MYCLPRQKSMRRRSVTSRHHDELVHPGRGHHVDGDSIRPGNQQEVAPLSRFEIVHLRLGEVEGSLELGCFGVFERTEQEDARIGCQDCPVLGFEEVARILAHQDQTATVLADPASQSDQKLPDRLMLEQESRLVDEKMPRSTISPKCSP